jgi:hypothetical protein
LLFGATSIGKALMGLPGGGSAQLGSQERESVPKQVPLPTVPPERDPYAGAGLVSP